jgi:hypothetical protein
MRMRTRAICSAIGINAGAGVQRRAQCSTTVLMAKRCRRSLLPSDRFQAPRHTRPDTRAVHTDASVSQFVVPMCCDGRVVLFGAPLEHADPSVRPLDVVRAFQRADPNRMRWPVWIGPFGVRGDTRTWTTVHLGRAVRPTRDATQK